MDATSIFIFNNWKQSQKKDVVVYMESGDCMELHVSGQEYGLLVDGDYGLLSFIRNDIKQFDVYKEFEICSEKEAYEQILDGNFIDRVNPGDKIEVGHVSMGYMLDTKGFYQPVYNFEVIVDGEEMLIQIPAIENCNRG